MNAKHWDAHLFVIVKHKTLKEPVQIRVLGSILNLSVK